MGSTARFSHEAHGVRVVHHHHGVVFVGQIADLRKLGNIAIHREDAIGGNHAVTCGRSLAQLRFEIGHVAVFVAEARRLAQANSINDARMIEFVGNDGVVLFEQRFKQSAVGVKARSVKYRVFRSQKGAKLGLQLFMNGLRATDKTHARQPIAPLIQGFARRTHNRRMVSQAEVVIGAHVQYTGLTAHTHFSLLGAGHLTFALIETGFFNPGNLFRQKRRHVLVHLVLSNPSHSRQAPPRQSLYTSTAYRVRFDTSSESLDRATRYGRRLPAWPCGTR